MKKRAELVKDYRDKFANPYIAAGLGYIDKVIFPRETCKKATFEICKKEVETTG